MKRMFKVVLVLALCVVLARAMLGADPPTAPQETAAVTQTYPPITTASVTQVPPGALPAIESEAAPAPAQKSVTGGLTGDYLILVNEDRPLPEEAPNFLYSASLGTIEKYRLKSNDN